MVHKEITPHDIGEDLAFFTLFLQIYDEAVERGMFLNRYQRSLYNVDRLTSRPFWTPEQTTYHVFFRCVACMDSSNKPDTRVSWIRMTSCPLLCIIYLICSMEASVYCALYYSICSFLHIGFLANSCFASNAFTVIFTGLSTSTILSVHFLEINNLLWLYIIA